jgi:hypothetical protein
MKKTLLKITTCILFVATMSGAAISSRAADSAAPEAKPEAKTETKSEAAGPAKFYGPVTAVDASAKSFTVGEQTFTVTTESHLTKDGKTVTLADAVVGEPARGSYTKGKDGKLDVTKVNFGKKAGGKSGGSGGGKKKTDSAAAAPAKE